MILTQGFMVIFIKILVQIILQITKSALITKKKQEETMYSSK